MTARRPLTKSVPFWILLGGSAASVGFGAWLALDTLSSLSAGLTDNTATAVDVYAGPSWVTLGSAFVVAGLVGFVAALALAAARSLAAVPADDHRDLALEADEAAQWQAEAPDVETTADVAAPAAAEPEPATANERL